MRRHVPSINLHGIESDYEFLAQSHFRALAAIVLLWPYQLLPQEANALMFALVSVVSIFLGLIVRGLVSNPFIMLFSFVALARLMVDLTTAENGTYLFSQSNHIWQFVLYYFGMQTIALNTDWQKLLTFRSVKIIIGLEVSLFLFLPNHHGQRFVFHEFDITIFVAFMVALTNIFENSRVSISAIAIVAVLLATMSRASSLFLLFISLGMRFLRPARSTTGFLIYLITIGPIVGYLLLSPTELRQLFLIDHNTYIRAEFINAATQLLKESPLVGIGFDTPYRPLNFGYQTEHNLLTRIDDVFRVSNHHSLFDIALKLGIPAAIIFWFGVFHYPRSKTLSWQACVISLFLATGASFNAWFENQNQIYLFSLLSGMLFSLKFQGSKSRVATAETPSPNAHRTRGV